MSQTPLLDMLRAHDPVAPWWVDPPRAPLWRAHRDRIVRLLREPALRAFVIDAAAKYYYEDNPREYWDLEELRGLKVPYGCCWMEHRLAETIHSEIGDQSLAALTTGHAGFLAQSVERRSVQGEGIPEGTDRLLWFEIFHHYDRGDRTEGPHGAWFLALDADGAVLGLPSLHGFHDPRHNEHLKNFQSELWPPLLALSEQAAAGMRRRAWAM